METKLKGKIELIKDVQTGINKVGKEWEKIEFTLRIDAEYDDLLCFEVFDMEKIKDKKVGDIVEVSFNIKCTPWNDRHITSLRAWKIFILKDESKKEEQNIETKEENKNSKVELDDGDLPF